MENVDLTKQQQRRQHVCENNWIRKIAGVRRTERRRMNGRREEIGTEYRVVGNNTIEPILGQWAEQKTDVSSVWHHVHSLST